VEGSGRGVEPIHAYLLDRATNRSPLSDALRFVFTGSQIHDGRVSADDTEQYVALWPDPTALLNATLPPPNPYRSEAGLAIPLKLPAFHTKVTLHLSPEAAAASPSEGGAAGP